jgi:hypothetical protein
MSTAEAINEAQKYFDAIAQVAEGTSKCERDLLLNRVDGWGAWITATYEGLLSKGLARRHTEANGLRITFDTPLAKAVKHHLVTYMDEEDRRVQKD